MADIALLLEMSRGQWPRDLQLEDYLTQWFRWIALRILRRLIPAGPRSESLTSLIPARRYSSVLPINAITAMAASLTMRDLRVLRSMAAGSWRYELSTNWRNHDSAATPHWLGDCPVLSTMRCKPWELLYPAPATATHG